MKKFVLILFGLTLLISCNNEPFYDIDNEENNPPENTLIIKQINDGDLDYFFDTDGKIETIKNENSFTTNGITYEFQYSVDKLLERQTNYFASEQASVNLTYSNGNLSNFAYGTLGFSFSESIIIADNKVSFINTGNIANPKNIEFTFATNSLKQLMHYEVTIGFQPTNTIETSIDYSYDTDGNLISYTETILYENAVNNTYYFTYDDKKNPVAESMGNNSLAYLISSRYNFIYQRLIQLSPNNIISNSKDQRNYMYQYNTDNYPETVVKSSAIDNSIINNLTYTYY